MTPGERWKRTLKEQAIYGRGFRNLAEALLHESSLTRTMPTGRISYLPMRYDAGRPKAVIRFKISQPRTTSTPLHSWAPGPEGITDNGLVSEERVLHPALTMVP